MSAAPWNLVVVMLDSLRQDHLSCYGNSWIKTPNIDRLAQECVVFENCYPEGLPTIPVRTALFTGQYTLPYRPWQPLTTEDITIAQILSRYGYTCGLVTDTYHMAKPDMNFHRGFHSWRWIRGQEADPYESRPHGRDLQDYMKPVMAGDRIERSIDQYLRNTRDFKSEEDWFCGQTMTAAMEWVRENVDRQPFFLWVDSFDPHEPWDPPPPYQGLYRDPNYTGPYLIHPRYGPVDWMTSEEMEFVRALYAEEVTYVDTWTGHFLTALGDLGLMDNTLIFLMADHGHPHGDHGKVMKTADNLYGELLHLPFMFRRPDGEGAGRRLTQIVQFHDFLPTALDMLGIGPEATAMHGQSMWPLVRGDVEKLRDVAIMGYHESPNRCLRDETWSLIVRESLEDNELYNLRDDPKEQRNVIGDHPDEAERLLRQLPRYFVRPGRQMASIQERYEYAGTAVG